MNLYIQSQTFKSRCLPIKDAQWVCHKVNTEMPHFSITKMKPLIIKQMNKLERHFPQREKTSIANNCLLNNLIMLCSNKKDLSQLNFIQQLCIKWKEKFSYTEEDKQIIKILNKTKNVIINFSQKRQECKQDKSDIINSLTLLEKYKLGNCKETANLAELILKINNIKNARTVYLKAENQNVTLDHAVCVFNIDGSPFSKIKRDTIVIDPWIDKADFAINMIKYYQSQCKHLFHIPKGQKIDLLYYKNDELTEKEIMQLRTTYPNFVFNNSKRNFMNL